MSCPLCGYTFESDESTAACQRCALAHGCQLTRCPRCGYEWAEDSRLVGWLRKQWARVHGGASS